MSVNWEKLHPDKAGTRQKAEILMTLYSFVSELPLPLSISQLSAQCLYRPNLLLVLLQQCFFLPIYSKGKKKKLLYVWRHLWNFLQNEKKWFLQISLLPVIRFKYIQFNSFLLTTLMDLKKQGENFRTWNKGREILMGKTFIPVNTLN